MELGDREFTSEEVAALCGVARVTVADWIVRGRLAVRWTTGGHRRIPRASLAKFMTEQGYVVPRSVASPRVLVVLVDDGNGVRTTLAGHLTETEGFDVRAEPPGPEAILAVGMHQPDVLVLPFGIPGFDTVQLIAAVRAEPALAHVVVVVLAKFEEEIATARRYGAEIAVRFDRMRELYSQLVRILRERHRRVVPSESGG